MPLRLSYSTDAIIATAAGLRSFISSSSGLVLNLKLLEQLIDHKVVASLNFKLGPLGLRLTPKVRSIDCRA